jgi:CRP/FNR family transcriptional regulator
MPQPWTDAFPALAGLDRAARRRLAAARRATVPAGEVVFREGDACSHYLMVLAGSVRVQMVSEQGREIVLYRVGGGQTCVLTTACLMGGQAYNAQGVVESEVTALMLPAAAFRDLVAESAGFRDFVFSAYGTRLSDLLLLVEEVAFRRVDARLAALLLARSEAGGMAVTHQGLAVELGTAREVISRQLKEFERRGWVRLGRGRVAVVRPEALAALAREGGSGAD